MGFFLLVQGVGMGGGSTAEPIGPICIHDLAVSKPTATLSVGKPTATITAQKPTATLAVTEC